MDNATRSTGRWDPSALAGTCGLSEANWNAILHLISEESTVLQQAIGIVKAAGAADAIWLEFLGERVKSAISSFPEGEPFYWTTEGLRMSKILHVYIRDLASKENAKFEGSGDAQDDWMICQRRQLEHVDTVRESDDNTTTTTTATTTSSASPSSHPASAPTAVAMLPTPPRNRWTNPYIRSPRSMAGSRSYRSLPTMAGPSNYRSPRKIARPSDPRSPRKIAGPSDPRSPRKIAGPSDPRSPHKIAGPSDPRSPNKIAGPSNYHQPPTVAGPSNARSPHKIAGPSDPRPPPTVEGPSNPRSPNKLAGPSNPRSPHKMAGPSNYRQPPTVAGPSNYRSPSASAGPSNYPTPPKISGPSNHRPPPTAAGPSNCRSPPTVAGPSNYHSRKTVPNPLPLTDFYFPPSEPITQTVPSIPLELANPKTRENLALALNDSSMLSSQPSLTFATTILDPSGTEVSYTFIYIDSPPSLRVFLDRIRAAHSLVPGRQIKTLDIGVGKKCMSIQLHEREGRWEWNTAVEVMGRRGGKADVVCEVDGE